MAEKRLFKEYNHIIKNDPHISNNQILKLLPTDPDNIFEWYAVICKPDRQSSAYYYHGQWKLDIKVTSQYPINPPVIKFNKSTPISHPNVDYSTGEICLDILKSGSWSPAWNLEHLVGAILMLIDDPEPDSPLNIDSANLFRHDKDAFESYVQYTLWKNGTLYEGQIRDSWGLKEPMDIETVVTDEVATETNEAKEDVTKVQAKEVATEADINEVATEAKTKEIAAAEAADEAAKEVAADAATNEVVKKEIKEEVVSDVPGKALENAAAAQDTDTAPVNVIKEVGEQITKQFMEKVDEIKHSRAASEDTTGSNIDYNHAKQQIMEKVDKQVKELCSKSVSPTPQSEEEPDDDKNSIITGTTLDDEKAKFLGEVNNKIHEHNTRRQAANAAAGTDSPNSMDTVKKSLSIKSVASKSSTDTHRSKRQIAKEKLKALVKH